MKTSQAIQDLITRLATENGLDLNARQVHLGLILDESHRLEIEKAGQRVIRVIHYSQKESAGDYFGDQITCFIGEAGWIPIERSHYRGTFITYAELTADGQDVVLIDQHDQTELVEFVDNWVHEIEVQSGFDNTQRWTPRRSGQPEPPSLETLLAWEDEGGCEATDGCWVEPDGTCPHGCQSWLIELGLI